MRKTADSVIGFTLLCFSLFFCTLPAYAVPKISTPPDVLFGPVTEISNISIAKKLPYLTQTSVIERGKIEYLIARVRQSELVFVRNGEMYPGKRAAMHLTRKYRKRIESIRTVEQFIQDVASGSSLSGQPYYVRFPDGNAYKVRDVFTNELRVLDEYLAQHR